MLKLWVLSIIFFIGNPADASDDPFSTRATAEYHFSLAQAYSTHGEIDQAIEEYQITHLLDPQSPLILTRLASEFLKKGLLSAAMESCQSALKLDPKYTEAKLILAGLYFTSQNWDAALAEYNQILKQNPNHEEAILFVAQVLLEKNQAKKAITKLRNFLSHHPDTPLIWFYLGRLEEKNHHVKQAILAYQHALRLKPHFVQAGLALAYLYETQSLFEKAISSYSKLIEDSQEQTAVARLSMLYLSQKKYALAIPYVQMLAEADPDHWNILLQLAFLQIEAQQYPAAIETFKKILVQCPDSDRIHAYLGNLYLELQRSSEAIHELKQIPETSKLYPEAILNLVSLLKKNNQLNEAKVLLAKAIQIQGEKSPNFYLLQAYLEDEDHQLQKAVQTLSQGLEKFPQNEKLRYYLGSLYDRQGTVEKSLEQMEAILKINPDHIDALNYIAYTWTEKGVQLGYAEKLLKKAIRLNPNNGYVQDSWGWNLFARGFYQKALIVLEKAIQLTPHEPVILEHLGDVYLRLNFPKKAFSSYYDAIHHTENETNKKKLLLKLENLKNQIDPKTPLPHSDEKSFDLSMETMTDILDQK